MYFRQRTFLASLKNLLQVSYSILLYFFFFSNTLLNEETVAGILLKRIDRRHLPVDQASPVSVVCKIVY